VHVYIHVPFCARRCSYCDFAIAVRPTVPSAAFADAIVDEWRRWQADPVWAASPTVDTVYFGGGTPSRLAPEAIAAILAAIRADRVLAADAEITLEANPDDVTAEGVAAWRAAGVNRVSLGVQSFDPKVLAWMHRTHDAAQAVGAVELLRAGGVTELSIDLIFALPSALERDWEADLAQAIALAPPHLSLYGLTIEPHTPLARWTARGDSVPADDRRYADEFLRAHERLTAAGYEHYEVSNYARPGHRARHNSAYWRRRPFVGLGPSAHSGFDRERRWNLRDWAAYHAAFQEGAPLEAGREHLDDRAVRLEWLYLGLRTADGLDPALIGPAGDRWITDGWAAAADGRLRLTAEGWLRLDALVAAVA
jgi:oxygen-independent coproporphyrinogen-3 oxidase